MFTHKKTILSTLVASSLLFASLSVSATDTRSMAMGGIGASTSGYLTAPFHNPALVARYDDSDDFGFLLPSISAKVSDKDDLLGQLDDFSDLYDDLGHSQNPADAQRLVDSLSKMQSSKGFVKADVGLAIAVPNKILSFNFFVKSYVDALVIADIDSADLNPNNLNNPTYKLKSQGVTMGVNITEIGLALAKKFAVSGGNLYVGVTPKYQKVKTINYIVSIDDYEFDDWNDDKYKNDDASVNVDFGLGYEFAEDFMIGASVTNLIDQEYKTINLKGVSATYELAPVYTVSASYSHSFFTVGIDADLNETDHYSQITGTQNSIGSFQDDNTQFVAVGTELNAFDWVQIRGGYQHDLSGNVDGQYTAGLGFSPFGTLHLDVSATYAGENELGAAVQTYLTF